MYNFNLNYNEELKEIFENVLIKKEDSEKTTTVALTNQRLLFLDYVNDEANEILRISRGIDYVKYKEVYYDLNLSDIKTIEKDNKFLVLLNDECIFEFDNYKLYEELIKK